MDPMGSSVVESIMREQGIRLPNGTQSSSVFAFQKNRDESGESKAAQPKSAQLLENSNSAIKDMQFNDASQSQAESQDSENREAISP